MMASVKDVYRFWQGNLCMHNYLKAPYLSREYFEQGSALRYKYHYHIPQAIEKLAGFKPGGRILEIGVGMGIDTQLLAQKGFQVTGIDLTDKSVEAASARLAFYRLPGHIQKGNAEALDFPDETFDAVYSFGVLHHTPDTVQAIAEVRRVLKKDGVALIMLYNKASLNYAAHVLTLTQFDGTWRERCPVERAYTRRQIKALFKDFSRLDLEVDYLFGTGWTWVNRLVPLDLKKKWGKVIGWHHMIWACR